MNPIFYIYIYLDPRNPGVYEYGDYRFDYEPFYGGKGKGKRCCEHLNKSRLKSKSRKNNKIKSILNEGLTPIIIKVKENLLECSAFKNEMDMIKTIGRLDSGTGPLTNHTDGGDGTSGRLLSKESRKKISESKFGKHLSEEHKKKISESRKGKKANNETRKKMSESRSGENNPNYGRIFTQECKEKMSEARSKYWKENPSFNSGEHSYNYGKKQSPETKKKISISHKGKLVSEEAKRNMSKSKSKENNPMFGRKKSPESVRRGIETRKRNFELKQQNKITGDKI